MKSIKVVDLELKQNKGIKHKFNLVSVDFKESRAVIQSQEVGKQVIANKAGATKIEMIVKTPEKEGK